MGKLWTTSDDVSIPNLNSPVVFDARVSTSAGATSGSTYQTVDAALAAGKRSIFVEAGDYAAGFSVGVPGSPISNVLVYCAVPSAHDGGFVAATFGGQITCVGNWITIVNAHRVGGTAAYGFRCDAGYFGYRLIDCRAYQTPFQGFALHYQPASLGSTAVSWDNECRGCVAEDCGGTLYEGFYVCDVDLDCEWLLDHCTANGSGLCGFQVCNQNVAATSLHRVVSLNNCTSLANVSHGLAVGPRASVIVNGGTYRNNAGAGVYFYTSGGGGTITQTAAARSTVNGARARYNSGAGFTAQTSTTTHALSGVSAYGNTGAAISNLTVTPSNVTA